MKKRYTIIGVDPGQSGAIAVFDPDGNLDVWDLKDFLIPTGGFRSLDPNRLTAVMRPAVGYENHAICFIEESLLVHGNGIKTTRPIFDSRGVLRAVFGLLNADCRFVPPTTWKRYYGLLRTEKSASVDLAIKLLPNYADFFRKEKGGRLIDLDGRAEAALIALYGTELIETKK